LTIIAGRQAIQDRGDRVRFAQIQHGAIGRQDGAEFLQEGDERAPTCPPTPVTRNPHQAGS